MACQRAHSGRKIFRPVFFALRKSAYRRVDNIRANLIAQKKTASNLRGGFSGVAQVCKEQNLCLVLPNPRQLFIAGSALLCKKQNYCLGLPNPMRFSCGRGASLQGRVYCTPLRKEFNFESIYDRKGTQRIRRNGHRRKS